ncbi:endonuclease III [Dissulfurispira thermophila]|uniref:Endonuclease III n=2 Tax=root TaxID=1 RepID=A0A7G1GYU5_9BACT|nr:endonuclease III domain-containing protein [Dissulfurispira thermophila]BCB95159.1 endonuclease III [Dissulfurispira thermophila]
MKPLAKIYNKLYSFYGPQCWWPGDTPFEIAVGAILTQNTNWGNVEKAIKNLKNARALSVKALHELPLHEIALLIKPAGYFNVKAKRLKSFVDFLVKNFNSSMEKMKKEDMESIRKKLLDVHGIGPETADSILLYALNKPVFVIDAYTKRVLSRHKILDYDASYTEYQNLFHKELDEDIQMFNEYHALFVRIGKDFCKPRPLCERCPLSDF